ncbi:MAG: hypothetical protein CTY19_05230 [Methylomonas sp.]|nr:MAG: hypothetical protein CTY19_05230 [Methylomonas sp.]
MAIKAYKFRPLNNFENIADIFCNNRFYASHYSSLNDPMEGMIKYEDDVQQESIDQVNEFKEDIRICSFSESFDNLLLWAHYADGFKGICIEIELISNYPGYPAGYVNYQGGFTVGNDILKATKKIQFAALLVKNTVWRYEKEIRVFTKDEYVCYPVVKINSVLLGIRTPDTIKQIILRTLPPNIDLWETEICNKNNKVKILKQLKIQ